MTDDEQLIATMYQAYCRAATIGGLRAALNAVRPVILAAERAARLAELHAIGLTAEQHWGAMDVVVAEIDKAIAKMETQS